MSSHVLALVNIYRSISNCTSESAVYSGCSLPSVLVNVVPTKSKIDEENSFLGGVLASDDKVGRFDVSVKLSGVVQVVK